MTDLVGGSARLRTLADIETHFRSRGYDIVNTAVYDGDVLVGVLQGKENPEYVF